MLLKSNLVRLMYNVSHTYHFWVSRMAWSNATARSVRRWIVRTWNFCQANAAPSAKVWTGKCILYRESFYGCFTDFLYTFLVIDSDRN